jgi:ribosomal protein L13
VKRYTALTKNFFRQLSRGEPVAFHNYVVVANEEKIVVRGLSRDREIEYHFRRKTGGHYGFSKDQFAGIFSSREKPLYSVRTPAER